MIPNRPCWRPCYCNVFLESHSKRTSCLPNVEIITAFALNFHILVSPWSRIFEVDQISGGSGPSDKGGEGWGWGGGRSSRPWDKARGWARSQKIFFRPFGPQFALKIRGGGGQAGNLPWILHWKCCQMVWKGLLNVPTPYFWKTFVSFSETLCT